MTPARPYHHGNLRAGLLEAAEAVLAERGAHGLTLRDVARAAGVSHGAPYHHFASLNELLAAVAERGFVILGDAMAEAVAVPDTRAIDVGLALAGWSLAHGLSHLMIDGAFEGLPMKKQNPDTLARQLSERLFG